MDYRFDRLPPDMQEQLVAVGRGASIPDCECAPLGGGFKLAALGASMVGAACVLWWRVSKPATLDPLDAGTIIFHGVLLVPFAIAAALAVGALIRRILSPLKPGLVLTPVLIVETGCAGDPVRVRRVDQVTFERNEPDRLVLRFPDGELAIPRLDERTGAIATSVWSRLANSRGAWPTKPADDAWSRTLAEIAPGPPPSGRARIAVLAAAGFVLGLGAWGEAWCQSFASRERAAWSDVEATGTAHGYLMYLDFLKKARASVPLFVLATSKHVEHLELAEQRRDDLSFAESDKAGSAAAIGKYLAGFTSGAHVEKARRLRDDRLFDEARRARSGTLLRAYLAEQTKGAHVAEARELLLVLFTETEQAYRSAGKGWLADLVASMKTSPTGVLPVIVESHYERDSRVYEAFEKAFARTAAGRLLSLDRAPNQTKPPRVSLRHALVATGGVYGDALARLAAEHKLRVPDSASTAPVKNLVVALTSETPGEKPFVLDLEVSPPQTLSVNVASFMKANPHSIEEAMLKALYEELERQLERDLSPR